MKLPFPPPSASKGVVDLPPRRRFRAVVGQMEVACVEGQCQKHRRGSLGDALPSLLALSQHSCKK